MSVEDVEKLVKDMGGELTSVSGPLPDGSGFATAKFPLPEDHWLYADHDNIPPMGLRCTDPQLRQELKRIITEAGRYAYRGASLNGKEDDIDPDALVKNLWVGLLGYFTPDALTHDAAEDPKDRYEPNPDPVPLRVVAIVRGT